nr:exodeoxyribonuclease V subunit gamma [Nocardioides convexus]
MLRGGPLVDLRRLVHHVYESITPMDFAAILANPIGFHPMATDARTGEAADLAPYVTDRSSLQTALRASACMPLLAGRPVRIGGRTYVDGGLSEGVPYRPALADGATHVLVLRTRRLDQSAEPPSRLERIVLAPYFLRHGRAAGAAHVRRHQSLLRGRPAPGGGERGRGRDAAGGPPAARRSGGLPAEQRPREHRGGDRAWAAPRWPASSAEGSDPTTNLGSVMTLHLHRAPRTDLLADELGALLARPAGDPFASEVVVVPARGVERWLTQRLSHRLGTGPRGGDGVCAGVEFLHPASLVGMLLGREADDPWHPDRLVWPLLATIDDSLGEAWCATLATHLGHGLDGEEGGSRRSRRWSVARRLAELFSSYAVQRPALVTDWREGRDTDGAGGALAPDLAWEAESVAPAARPGGGGAPGRAARPGLRRPARGGPPRARPARPSLPVRPHPAAGDRDRPARRTGRAPRGAPVAGAALRGAVGRGAGRGCGGPPARDGVLGRPRAPSAARLPGPRLPRVGDRARGPGRHGRGARRRLRPRAGRSRHPARLAPGRPAGQRRAGCRDPGRPGAGRRRPQRPGARLPRPGAPGRRAAGGAGRPARGRPDAGAARHRGDVPRHRDLRTPRLRRLRPRWSIADEGSDDELHPAHRLRVRLADRAASSTNPLLSVAVALVESRRRPGHRLAGDRPAVAGGVPAAVRVR